MTVRAIGEPHEGTIHDLPRLTPDGAELRGGIVVRRT
jgi:hypothetical protein